MSAGELKKEARLKRKKRIRKKMMGTSERPRLTVFRSAKHIYVQAVDDTHGNTLATASSVEKIVKDIPLEKKGKISMAALVGKCVAERLIGKGIKKAVFDRNGFLYHGRIKAVADAAREAGLDF